MEPFLAARPIVCILRFNMSLPQKSFIGSSNKSKNFIRKVKVEKISMESTGEGGRESESTSTNSVGAVEMNRSETEGKSIMLKRITSRRWQRYTYLFAAVASTLGITTLAAVAVYYRFIWQMQETSEIPWLEIFGTFCLAVGAAVGMEFWAGWAHRTLWHASLWSMHKSHHRPRQGPFELNDVFAITNAVPAIILLAFGVFHKGLIPGLCFGAGLGITMFGMAYMFVHDGLVHQRFPVGPIANVPYLQKVAAAHQLHHADLFNGVPYGLFLGLKDVEATQGLEELEKLLQMRQKAIKENDSR